MLNGGFDESNPAETNRDDCADFGAPPPAGAVHRNAGSNAALPPDTADLDQDGDKADPIPFDVDGNPRIVQSVVDIGPWEGS